MDIHFPYRNSNYLLMNNYYFLHTTGTLFLTTPQVNILFLFGQITKGNYTK